MLRVVIFLIILTYNPKTSAQNLLANGSLADRNRCTEFNAFCAPEAWFFIPGYIKAETKEDNNWFEIVSMGNVSSSDPLSSAGYRNYFYTKLLCTLKAGNNYKIEIWVNTGNHKFDHLDFWVGSYEPGKRRPSIFATDPTFTITSANEDSSKPRWKRYSIVYTAKGGEQFLMVGNLSRGGMDKSKTRSLSKKAAVLYAIDDLMLTAVDNNEKACAEYDKILAQVYNQNKRHPPGFIEDIETEKPMPTRDTVVPRKEVIWVIVDTPPSLRKPVNDTLTIPDVLFLYNSSKLNPKFIKELNDVLEKLRERNFKALEITGHTDNKGDAEYNLKLSKDRANAIKEFLIATLQLNPGIVVIKGMGETNPVASNETAAGRQKNRRVEIIVKH